MNFVLWAFLPSLKSRTDIFFSSIKSTTSDPTISEKWFKGYNSQKHCWSSQTDDLVVGTQHRLLHFRTCTHSITEESSLAQVSSFFSQTTCDFLSVFFKRRTSFLKTKLDQQHRLPCFIYGPDRSSWTAETKPELYQCLNLHIIIHLVFYWYTHFI